MAENTAHPSTIPKRPQRQPKSRLAEAEFRARVEELGGTVVEPHYLNSRTPHRVICAAGHECAPTPSSVQRGWGLCLICAGCDSGTAEAAFRRRLQQLGATLLEPAYLGSKMGHRVACAKGHECWPRPKDLSRGTGLCRTCAHAARRKTPIPKPPRPKPSIEAARNRFFARVAELGGTVLGEYVDTDSPVLVRCRVGHEVMPSPGNVLRGTGICRICAGRSWDVFYVVRDDLNDVAKFGVTSGDPHPRLRDHARDGFEEVLRLHVGLPGDVAPDLERTVLAALRDAREEPVRGREYFPDRVLALILDLVDNHPSIRAS